MKTIHWLFRIIKDLIKKFKPVTYSNGNDYKSDPIYVMSFNIERDKPSKNDWPERRELIDDLIYEIAPNIICMQEVMPHQYKYLKNQFIDYNSYFVDAFTGNSKGAIVSEGLSIFYAKDKYYLHEQGFIRLNNQFGFKTKNWRICQWIKLSTRRVYNKPYEYEEIYVFNVHLDHEDEESRKIGIEKILNKIEEIKQSKNYLPTKSKFFICGDFNMEISWYNWFKDFAKNFSFNHFKEGTIIDKQVNIDYIFTTADAEHTCLRTIMSDHYPIIAKCK